ncbi:MAG: hypothetical protein KA392_07580 [Candidatus Obscuribacter sp.]|nr:hypothetical protein [Candidatus Obscuribacter sp.]MBP6592127.1 hypothetical protein [Candidatus Obscuribacter sp.]
MIKSEDMAMIKGDMGKYYSASMGQSGPSQSGSASSKGRLSRNEARKFVENHPASQTIMPRNIDRSMFGHAAAESGRHVSAGEKASHHELSEKFIGSFSPERSADVLSWMDELKADSTSFIEARYDKLVEQEMRLRIYRSAVSFLIDRLFQDLSWFALEFNKVARSTSMQINATILGDVTEVLQANSKREAEATSTFFRARLSNRHYALVVRGGVNVIQFFLVPTTQVMAQSQIEQHYQPAAELEVKVVDRGVSWRLKGGQTAPESIEALAMHLFGLLIEVTKQEVRREEARQK